MTPLQIAITGTIARAVLQFAAGHGFSLGSDMANEIAQGIVVLGSAAWGITHQVKVDTKIKDLKSQIE